MQCSSNPDSGKTWGTRQQGAVWAVTGLLCALTLTLAWAGPARADARRIRARAEAVVRVAPDRALLDVGVVTESPEAETAARENAERVETTIAALRRILGDDATIETRSYNLAPRYQYVKPGGERRVTGYTASNVLTVTIDDLSLAGKVIDAATGSGANQIQQIRFTLKDDEPARREALARATERARSRAEVVAKSLGLRIVGVLSAEVGSASGPPILLRGAEMSRVRMAAATPIEPKTLDIRESVTLEIEVEAP